MTAGPDNAPPLSPAEPPVTATDSTAAASSATERAAPETSPKADAAATERSRLATGAGILGLVVLGGVLSSVAIPRLVEAVPTLRSVFPGSNAALIDDLSAELAAQDSVLTALKRRLEAQSSRVATLSDETAAQSSAIADLESRVGALDQSGPARSGSSPAARLEMLSLRINQLESAFVPLSQRANQAIESARSQKELLAAQSQLSASLTTFEERLATLERSAAGDRRGALIALSFAALREIANRGRPFAAEYEALSNLLTESNRPELAAELQEIAAFAPSGAPSVGSLRGSFTDAATAMLHAASMPENASWWRRALAEIRTLVIIRPTGEATGSEPGAIIARAEQRLNQNNLAAAVEELKTLPAPALQAAAPWLRGAEARLAVDEALARFANVLIHAVATDDEPATAPAIPAAPGNNGAALPSNSGA